MNAIIGMTHLTLQTELLPKQQNYLNKIQSSADALLGIINDILDFSKIEAGRLDLESVNFNLESVLTNLCDLVTLKVQEKDLELLFNIDKDVPLDLVGDPLRLGQVLLNLTHNAVKFTDDGEIVISTDLVEKDLEADPGKVVLRFSVKDTGIGIKREQMPKLFQSFSQADGSTTRKYGGTGLGLAICKQLVDLMDGEISVESEYGKGSAFTFTAEFGHKARAKAKTRVPAVGFKDKRAMVVDDNVTSREILKNALDSFGFNVTTVNSGEEALKELESSSADAPYELVLMDWKMPQMNGIEAAKGIKGTLPRKWRRPPISRRVSFWRA